MKDAEFTVMHWMENRTDLKKVRTSGEGEDVKEKQSVGVLRKIGKFDAQKRRGGD